MMSQLWRVVVTRPARADLRSITAETIAQFGPAQARRYRAIIEAALGDLKEGPENPLVRRRENLPSGVFLMPIRRRGVAARHLLICQAGDGRQINVLRVLHDAMDLPNHLIGLHEEATLFDMLR